MTDKLKAIFFGTIFFVIGFQVFMAMIQPYLPLIGKTLAYAAVALIIMATLWLLSRFFGGGGRGGGLMRGR